MGGQDSTTPRLTEYQKTLCHMADNYNLLRSEGNLWQKEDGERARQYAYLFTPRDEWLAPRPPSAIGDRRYRLIRVTVEAPVDLGPAKLEIVAVGTTATSIIFCLVPRADSQEYWLEQAELHAALQLEQGGECESR